MHIAIAIKNVSCSEQELAFMYVFTVTIPRIDIGIGIAIYLRYSRLDHAVYLALHTAMLADYLMIAAVATIKRQTAVECVQ